MSIESGISSGEEKKNIELSLKEEKDLFFKVLEIFRSSTFNSYNLGEYTNTKMLTVEVFRRLREFGLLEFFNKIRAKLKFIPDDDAIQLERLSRIVLKEVEEIINNRTEKNQGL